MIRKLRKRLPDVRFAAETGAVISGGAPDLLRRRRLDQAGQLRLGARGGAAPSLQGAGHMSESAFVETTISSRWPARSLRRICPNVSSAEPYGGP
jgi:hypothetical protein